MAVTVWPEISMCERGMMSKQIYVFKRQRASWAMPKKLAALISLRWGAGARLEPYAFTLLPPQIKKKEARICHHSVLPLTLQAFGAPGTC